MRTVILAVAFASQAIAQPADGASADRARAIVMRHMEAIGGLAAYSAVQSAHVVMTLRYPLAELTMRTEMWTTKPNLAYMRTRSDFGATDAGFDGKVYWTITPGEGARILTRPPDLLNAAVFDPYSALARYDVKHVGLRDRGGKQMEALEFVAADGQLYTQYFDPKSGLFSRLEVGSPSAPLSSIRFDRYRKFDGLLYATQVITKLGDGNESVGKVLSVDHKPVDPKRYELPPSVRDMARRNP